jgi:TRAP-type C4-dicarboxylate transport system substrate-binding protein
MNIIRRKTLKAGLFCAASLSLIGFNLSISQNALAAEELTGVYYIPGSYEALSYGTDGFIKFLETNSSDKIKANYYHSSQLLKADEQLPALRAGSIDFMFHTSSYITRSLPILGITGLPGVVEDLYRHPERLAIDSPLFNLINEQLAKENLYMLSSGGGILEPEYIWSTEADPIKSLDDLKGKKIRVVSFEATELVQQFGGAAVRIPSSETYLALQRGTVDAGVFNISTIIGRSLQEQLAFAYKLPMTGFTVSPFMLRSRWDTLDSGVKESLQEASVWYDNNFVKMANESFYPEKFWPKVNAAGIKIINPSSKDIESFNKATVAIWAKWKKEVGEDVGQRAIDLALGI